MFGHVVRLMARFCESRGNTRVFHIFCSDEDSGVNGSISRDRGGCILRPSAAVIDFSL